MMICRLCASKAKPFITVGATRYLSCDHCGLRFMDACNLPNAEEEKSHYDQHENNPADEGYRKFLSQVSDPLKVRLSPNAEILDFGAGPGPALAAMMEEAGHHVSIYDPFYAPDISVLQQVYDVVMATEVVEHFHEPADGFQQMIALLKPAGVLAIMTNLQDDDAAFAHWYYRRDPTHVAFYREETLAYIAHHHGLGIDRISRNVTFFTKLTDHH